MPDAIGILVIEREPLLRRGLVGCLKVDRRLNVLDAVATAEEGYRRADELLPNVALVGTSLPDAPGLGAATELRRRFPALATVVLADAESDDELFGAIRAGASAYLPKDVAEAELRAIVKRAAAGEYVINEQLLVRPSIADRVLEEFRSATAGELAPANAIAPLTHRELEILRGVRDGQTNAKIGQALGISPQTVKNHVTSILRKLAVNDRTQAVVLALRRGWLSIDASSEPAPTPARPTALRPVVPPATSADRVDGIDEDEESDVSSSA